MKILVTGASGFIGYHLCGLLQNKYNVIGIDDKRGFGGACFPKDTLAFAEYSKNFSVLNEVIERNNTYRNKYERDSREIEQNVNFKLEDLL